MAERRSRIIEVTASSWDEAKEKAKEDKEVSDPTAVLVRELGDHGIALRAAVLTHTVEENFIACSDIRRNLVERFSKEPDIAFAYPHLEIVPPEAVQD